MSLQHQSSAQKLEAPESPSTSSALIRLRSLFRLSALPGWLVLAWEAIDHFSRLDFVLSKGGLLLNAVLSFLSTHPGIRLFSGIAWLTLVVVWPKGFVNKVMGRTNQHDNSRRTRGHDALNSSSGLESYQTPREQGAEIERLKAELAKLSGLAFEVDTNFQSNARLRPHHDVTAAFHQTQNNLVPLDKYLLTLQFKIQFENHDTHTRALKRIELSLIERLNDSENRIPFLDEPDMLQINPDSPDGSKLSRLDKSEFLPQGIETVWLQFLARLSQTTGERLEKRDGDVFLRLTLHALGQQPFWQDFDVDWIGAVKNSTYLSLRSK